jgi:hypothetical protein
MNTKLLLLAYLTQSAFDQIASLLFFDKLPEITDFGLLQQSQNRVRF